MVHNNDHARISMSRIPDSCRDKFMALVPRL